MDIMSFLNQQKVQSLLNRNLKRSNEDLQELQVKKAKAIIGHAYKHTLYYKELFKDAGIDPTDIKCLKDLEKIPITSKNQLRMANTDIIASNINLKQCKKHQTSGSTGKPLIIYFTPRDDSYASASYERARIVNGFHPIRDKFVNITTTSSQGYDKWSYKCGLYRRDAISIFDSIESQIQALYTIKPDVIWGYPSAINIIATEIAKNNIGSITPRTIFTASELLDSTVRDNIESIFHTSVVDIYGSHETGCIAWECPEHEGYHTNMDTLVIEIVDKSGEPVDAGERGRVVVTNFHSLAMPIIRYEIGDYAVPTYEECSCGHAGYLIKKIEGRYDDQILLPGDKVVSPLTIWSMMRYIEGVLEFQVVQESKDKLVVYLVIDESWNADKITQTTQDIYKQHFGNEINVLVKIVPQIERNNSGKLRSVISKVL